MEPFARFGKKPKWTAFGMLSRKEKRVIAEEKRRARRKGAPIDIITRLKLKDTELLQENVPWYRQGRRG